jgi:hypothetical protein
MRFSLNGGKTLLILYGIYPVPPQGSQTGEAVGESVDFPYRPERPIEEVGELFRRPTPCYVPRLAASAGDMRDAPEPIGPNIY